VGSLSRPQPRRAGDVAVITGVEYEVPAGIWGDYSLVLADVGSGFVNGIGNVVVSVTVNQPVGLTSTAGYGLPDYTNMVVQIGDAQLPVAGAGGWVIDGR